MTWKLPIKLTNRAKLETHIVGLVICRETLKYVKNEKYTLYDLEYGEKTDK